MKSNAGIALIAVMAALMVLSAIALGLAASVRTEARIDATDWDALQAEELARSGQEFAAFLETRGLSKSPDFMAGLPFEAPTPGFHYRAQLPTGVVDIYFESDNGKLDLSSAPPEVLTNFFSIWTGDSTQAQLITAAIEDWRDPDNDARTNGAEAPYYAPLNYAPRNTGLGLADAPLIRGIAPDDFQLKPTRRSDGVTVLREGLDAYVTSAGAGSFINPNFASEPVLRSVPGLSQSQVETILASRTNRLFDDSNDFQARTGLLPDSQTLKYLTLNRNAPAVSSIARLKSSAVSRSERRVNYSFSAYNLFTGQLEPTLGVGRIQRGIISKWLDNP
jgi:type II secretory pathway component PulK